MMIVAALVGAASALLYLRRRNWICAGLAIVAAAALALAAGRFTLPGEVGATLTIDPANPPVALDGVRALALSGDGLREAEWQDLPARPLAWTKPATSVIRLEFPRQLALGRVFRLTVHRSGSEPGRLQLLAENGQALAEARGEGDLTVEWLPPLAEPLVLQARLFDGSGKLVAQGPVPVSVRDARALQVQGRLSAPSFDLRILDELLADSNALIDWQVTLGKTVTRSETARSQMTPNLLVIDAAWFERASASARTALLDQVAQGTPLLVLAGNANDAALWSRTLGLDLKPQPADKQVGSSIVLTGAHLAPVSNNAGEWTGTEGVLWTRAWKNGRIGWLAAADWHRYAISEPQALSLWWQGVLDRLGVQDQVDVVWLDPLEMPLPGQRLEVCAQGVRGEVTFPELGQTLAWQRRPDKADAACVAVWPQKAGWLRMQAQGTKPALGEVYVFAREDWPMWQAAQRRDATARYAARTPVPGDVQRAPLSGWPFVLLFGVAMLALWWRERR
ncbi:hypothetical protein [Massilia horti]|uniref:Transmembrane protein n=1 Tax=Massilia horti TaxID=2562153 RepID=A0A4Y9TA77_9BURK|nr:hypothetical protein [Massilia horti]TFW35225.1 hypothetical protein E4O92_02405 [Massilia horti]